jgi:hypothetical protein
MEAVFGFGSLDFGEAIARTLSVVFNPFGAIISNEN